MRTRRTRTAAFAAIASLSLVAAACGSDDNDSAATTAAGGDTATTMESMTSEPMTTEMEDMESMPMTSDGEMMMEPMGPACESVPTDGEGSFEGMADDPAATAASNNPELSTLVTAVTEADLVDTLNGEGPFTIFAPVNSAFEAIDSATMDTLMADPSGALTDILTLHVVGGEALDATALTEAGTATNVAESELTIAAEGETVTVDAGGGPATVVCANITVGNGIVHLIDTVLLPAS
ncbi:hypothetical protein BH18ACT2_BH18ACT2_05920 [soil metagenome]